MCAALLKYLDTDTICFQEERPRALVRLQEERWDPILTWTREHFGVEGGWSCAGARLPFRSLSLSLSVSVADVGRRRLARPPDSNSVNVYDGLFISKQPQATRERLADHIAAFDGWKLAGRSCSDRRCC